MPKLTPTSDRVDDPETVFLLRLLEIMASSLVDSSFSIFLVKGIGALSGHPGQGHYFYVVFLPQLFFSDVILVL